MVSQLCKSEVKMWKGLVSSEDCEVLESAPGLSPGVCGLERLSL